MATNKKKKKAKIRRRIIIGVIFAIIIFFIIQNSKGDNKKLTVEYVKAEKSDIEDTLTATGVVKSDETKAYYAITNLKISKVDVETGDLVSKGDYLIHFDENSIDNEILQNELNREANDANYKSKLNDSYEKQLEYNAANSSIEEIEAAIDNQENYIKGLQDGIEAEKNKRLVDIAKEEETQNLLINEYSRQLNKAGANLSNDDINYYNGLISDAKARLDMISTERVLLENFKASENKDELLRIAQKDLSKLNEMLEEAKSTKRTTKEQILNPYDVNSINASTKLLEQQSLDKQEKLEEAKKGIKADFDGVVTAVSVIEGQSVTEGTLLVKVETLEDVSVEFSASKFDLKKIKEGQKADITIAGNEYEGEVSKISHIASNNEANSSASVLVKVDILNPDNNIFLEVDGKMVIHADKATDVVSIPVETINRDADGEFVYKVVDNKTVKTYIKSGISSSTNTEVTEGVSVGDCIVETKSDSLFDGLEVEAIEMQ